MAQVVETGATLGNPLFRAYILYCSVLVIKMMAMSFLTAIHRFKNRAFANPEDAKNMNVKVKVNEDVERIRRAHLNDVENIPLFFVSAYLYILSNPTEFVALNLFRLYVVGRFIHTYVYAVHVVPQPARALAWFTGYVITGYMAFSSALTFLSSW